MLQVATLDTPSFPNNFIEVKVFFLTVRINAELFFLLVTPPAPKYNSL
jgi:hypothetical protein